MGRHVNPLFAEYFEKQLELNPLMASSIGDDRYNDRFEVSISPEWRQRSLAVTRDFLERARAIDASKLDGQELLSYQVFVYNLERHIGAAKYPAHLLPINQFYSTPDYFAQLGSGSSLHPFRTIKDYEDFLKRVDGFLAWVEQAIVNMNEGIEKNYRQPKILVERIVPQLEEHIVEHVTDSLFWKPIDQLPEDFDAADRERLQAEYRHTISERIVPAYAKLRDYMRDTYLPASRDTHGMWDLPDGDDWYAFRVDGTTTTELTPAQIHQVGLDEVKRIHEEMHSVMRDTGFEGTLDEFFEFMNTDPRFIAETQDELLQSYRDMKSRIEPHLSKLFDVRPSTGYEVRAVEPFRQKTASGASYIRGTPDGSRRGVFYVNAHNLAAHPKWKIESLSLHEAEPGHHFQIAIQQERDELPDFRRFGDYMAFMEGWALYAENLGEDLGVYTDPYQHFGKLNAELWRAIRLVVDTGLHYKRWSREDMLAYMHANSTVQEARAVAEAERYMAIPSQALAYTIGQLELMKLRGEAERRLGDKFDIREFHNQVLLNGALPLKLLESNIDRWIEANS